MLVSATGDRFCPFDFRYPLSQSRVETIFQCLGDSCYSQLCCLLFIFGQAGKVLFGLIIGWTIITSLGMSWLVNLLVGPGGDIGMHACCSILGYCLLPQIFLALFNLVVGKSIALSVLALFCVLWSTRVASRFVVVRLKAKHIPVEEQRSLLAYPWLLTFSMFALLSLY